ncbi:RloB domain-containing protein [Nonomuraea spiralis]|uniref:RloB domain-containing protein n=1 Tax=Nonomuraea spiralis TaxID=46182 RepID=UPI0037AE9B33
MAEEDAHRPDNEQYAEIWALFDRDQHGDLDDALNALKGHSKIRISLSHPSFDFWLYLHYGLYDQPQDGWNHQVHQMLSQRPGFAGFGSRDKRISKSRADELLPRLKTAYDNARSLDKRCATGKCAHPRGTKPQCGPLDQDPSSGMWRLLDSLGVLPFL